MIHLPKVSRRAAGVAVTGLALAMVGAVPAQADVSNTPAKTWGTNGRVSVILPVGDRVFIGGTFTAVTDTAGRNYPVSNLAAFVPSTGQFDLTWQASADAAVTALAAAGGKVYVGGSFAKVDGTARTKLAAVDATTGALDQTWKPKTDRPVDSMTALNGQVYLAGLFATVTDGAGAHAQAYAARVDGTSGTLDAGWAPQPNNRVRTVVAAPSGARVFLGGDFTSVSGVTSANKVASIVTASGAVDTAFKPGANNLTTKAPVYDLATDGSRLAVGAAGSGGACTAMDATTGQTLWSKHTNGNLQSVRIMNGTVFCGGHFSGTASFDGVDRNKLASVDLATGTTSAFAPKVNSALGVWSLGADATRLYVGGDFTKIGTSGQPYFAMFVNGAAMTAPAAPTRVTGTAGDASAVLSWDAPSADGGSPVNRYRIYRTTNGKTKLAGTTPDLSFTDTGLTNGTAYQYAVSAVNAVGEGALSASVTVTPKSGVATVPGVPTKLSVSSVTGATQLAWTAPAADGGSPITGYRIYRGTVTGQETLLTTIGTATSYTDTAVTTGTRYYYQVTAVNAVGESVRSGEASAVPGTGVPSAPVLSASVSAGKVALSWTVPSSGSPITQYVLVRDNVRVAKVSGTTQSFTDTGVVKGTSYSYKVKASNSIGASKYSNAVTVVAQ